MIAPKKIDLFCEILAALQPIFVMLAGGPAALQGWLALQGVPADMAHVVVPIWVPILCAVLAYIDAQILKMCYPNIQLPTTANQSTVTTVTTPPLPGHPSTEIKVETAAAGTPSITEVPK